MDILKTEIIAGNNSIHILSFFLSILLSWIAGRVLQKVFSELATRIENQGKITIAVAIKATAASIVPLGIGIGIKLGFLILHIGPSDVESFFSAVTNIILVLVIAHWIFNLVDVPDYLLRKHAEKSPSKLDDMLAPIVRKSLRLTVVLLALLQIAQLLSGKELSAIVAGLGIGGLAFALAAQDTIKNFFGSIVLFSDKPFEMGDRINIDGHDGTVEEVGLRSTRIRRLDGHLVTIPNGELANKAIWNIAKRPFIRNLFTISVTYDTTPEKLEQAKSILEKILENHEGMKEDFPPRVYFQSLNSHSLDFLVIYWYHPPAYWDYMAFTEKVNLEIVRQFNEAGIDFAFPTQTLHLASDPNRSLNVNIAKVD